MFSTSYSSSSAAPAAALSTRGDVDVDDVDVDLVGKAVSAMSDSVVSSGDHLRNTAAKFVSLSAKASQQSRDHAVSVEAKASAAIQEVVSASKKTIEAVNGVRATLVADLAACKQNNAEYTKSSEAFKAVDQRLKTFTDMAVSTQTLTTSFGTRIHDIESVKLPKLEKDMAEACLLLANRVAALEAQLSLVKKPTAVPAPPRARASLGLMGYFCIVAVLTLVLMIALSSMTIPGFRVEFPWSPMFAFAASWVWAGLESFVVAPYLAATIPPFSF